MSFRLKKIELSNDIPSIGLLRGIASAMVCFYHLSNGNTHFFQEDNALRQSGEWGRAGVQVFFIISGFVIPYSMYRKNYRLSDFWVFLKKRVIRIEPPYLISIVLILLLNFVSTLSPYYRGAAFTVDWANVMGHIAYLNIFTGQKWLADIYWTLAVEFQYYILIAIVFQWITSKKAIARLLFFAGFMGLFYVQFLGFNFIFFHAVYFMLGILLFQFFCKLITPKEFWPLLVISLGLLLYEKDALFTIVSVSTILLLSFVQKVPAFLNWLGLISYSLYLVHIPIGGRIINVSEALIHQPVLRLCAFFIAFAICIFSAWIYYNWVERRFKKLSTSIFYNKSKPGTVFVT